jgi:hypothetical protein
MQPRPRHGPRRNRVNGIETVDRIIRVLAGYML